MNWYYLTVLYVVMSLIVSVIGKGRKIGMFKAMMASLLLTPLLGFIIAINSRNIHLEEAPLNRTSPILENGNYTVGHKVGMLKKMLDNGEISEEEYHTQKAQLLG